MSLSTGLDRDLSVIAMPRYKAQIRNIADTSSAGNRNRGSSAVPAASLTHTNAYGEPESCNVSFRVRPCPPETGNVNVAFRKILAKYSVEKDSSPMSIRRLPVRLLGEGQAKRYGEQPSVPGFVGRPS
jgi:hypothetical protein